MSASETDTRLELTVPGFERIRESSACGSLLGNINGLMIADPKLQKTLEPHWNRLLEMVLLRLADTYLTYLSHLLALIFVADPSSLKRMRGDEKTSFDLEIIIADNPADDRIRTFAEDQVSKFSRKGIKRAASYFKHRFRFNLFPSDEPLNAAIVVIAVRNILTHNNGRVNREFIRETGLTNVDIGARVELKTEMLESFAWLLDNSAGDIDERAVERWKLPTVSVLIAKDAGPVLLEDSPS